MTADAPAINAEALELQKKLRWETVMEAIRLAQVIYPSVPNAEPYEPLHLSRSERKSLAALIHIAINYLSPRAANTNNHDRDFQIACAYYARMPGETAAHIAAIWETSKENVRLIAKRNRALYQDFLGQIGLSGVRSFVAVAFKPRALQRKRK